MIVLMPYGGSVANKNHFNGVSYDAILLDLLVQVDKKYRTDGRSSPWRHLARRILGVSPWVLRFPDDSFVAIGGHSPFFDALIMPSRLSTHLTWHRA